MSLYRKVIVAVAAMGLATCAFAVDEATTNNTATDNTQVQATPSADNSAASNTEQTADAKLNINTATAKDLMKIKGLNAAKAKAIITYRKKHGDFKSVEDLKEVKGFKKMDDKSLQAIQDQLTIG